MGVLAMTTVLQCEQMRELYNREKHVMCRHAFGPRTTGRIDEELPFSPGRTFSYVNSQSPRQLCETQILTSRRSSLRKMLPMPPPTLNVWQGKGNVLPAWSDNKGFATTGSEYGCFYRSKPRPLTVPAYGKQRRRPRPVLHEF